MSDQSPRTADAGRRPGEPAAGQIGESGLAAFLAHHYLFSPLSRPQLRDIAAAARLIRLAENEALFAQGEPAREFFLVVEGRMRLYLLSPAGNEKIVEIIEAGQSFAEAAAFFHEPRYPVWAASLTPCTLAAVDSRVYVETIMGAPHACRELMGDLSRRLHFLINQINDLTLKNATARVAGYLLSRLGPGDRELELHVSKCMLACYLSLQPETFSRIMKQLSDEGIIRLTGTRIRVEDSERLRGLSDPCDCAG
ncbi:MAG: Crp/Fnr family transcriptional regulator [Chromatiales bacterium]|jgi:CRP-like cAMP-binding protein